MLNCVNSGEGPTGHLTPRAKGIEPVHITFSRVTKGLFSSACEMHASREFLRRFRASQVNPSDAISAESITLKALMSDG